MDRNQSNLPPPHPPQFYRTSLQPQQNVAELQQASLMKVSWWVPNASCSCQEICCCWRMLMCNIMSQRLNSHSIKNIVMEQCSLMGKYSHFLIKMAQVFRHGPSATSTSSKMNLVCPHPPPSQKLHKHCFQFLFGEERKVSCLGIRGGSHVKGAGMLVVSLRGVNFRFWSNLRCSGQNTIIFSRKGLF